MKQAQKQTRETKKKKEAATATQRGGGSLTSPERDGQRRRRLAPQKKTFTAFYRHLRDVAGVRPRKITRPPAKLRGKLPIIKARSERWEDGIRRYVYNM